MKRTQFWIISILSVTVIALPGEEIADDPEVCTK